MRTRTAFTLCVLALLVLTGSQALAVRATIDFTEVFADPPPAQRLLVGDEWQAYGITTENAFWYSDTRDPFDGMGLSAEPGTGSTNPATIYFNNPTNIVAIDWWTIAGTIYVDAYDVFGTHLGGFSGSGHGTNILTGQIKRLTFHDTGGEVQISTLYFNLKSGVDDVQIVAAVWLDFGFLVVIATSSAAPRVSLVASIPGILPPQQMVYSRNRYVLAIPIRNVLGQQVVVQSSGGGRATATIQ